MPPRKTKQERQEERRAQMLRDAASALVETPGSSMAEIAQAIGISRATLYRHFPTREDLVRELALAAVEDSDRATAHIGVGVPTYRRAFEMLFEAMIPLGDRYHFLTGEARVMRDPVVAREVERQTRDLHALVEGAKQTGELDATVPSALVASTIDALVYVAWSAVQRGDVSAEDAARQAMRVLWRGVASSSDE